jgi:hypothetical protein
MGPKIKAYSFLESDYDDFEQMSVICGDHLLN